MYIQPFLELSRAEIIQGLASGKYRRWGGVIRYAAGQPQGGQIVTMLRDAGELTQLVNPMSAGLKAMDLVVNVKGHMVTQRLVREGFAQTHKMLGQVMTISSIGAGASVLNLGLTAVGFYIINKKLNKLQSDMTSLMKNVEYLQEGISVLDQKIDGISQRLVELKYIALVADDKLDQILSEVFKVQRMLRAQQKAKIITALRILNTTNSSQDEFKKQRQILEEQRISLTIELDGTRLTPQNNLQSFFETLDAFRLWALIGMTEITLARSLNNAERATQIANELASISRKLTHNWCEDLFPQKELGGTGRFSHSSFHECLLPETRQRLIFAQKGQEVSKSELLEAERIGSEAMLKVLPTLEKEPLWFEKQAALAEVLDMVEETTERLESFAWKVQHCEDLMLDTEQWENLALDENDSETKLIEDWNRVFNSSSS